MTDNWYYHSEEFGQVGPVSLDKLKRILAALSNPKAVLVWHSGLKDWVDASNVRELSGILTAAENRSAKAAREILAQRPSGVACQGCGRELGKRATRCPDCGAKAPKSMGKQIVAGSLIAVGIFAFVLTTHETSTTTQPRVTEHFMKRDAYGCRSKEAFERVARYAGEKDHQAFLLAIISGNCPTLKKGQTVALEDTALFSGLLCVRPTGEIGCYWTFVEAVGDR